MAKILEKAIVCEAIERESKDGKYNNGIVRLYEYGTWYPSLIEMKVKPEEIKKWKTLEAKMIENVILDEFYREGVSKAGKAYSFTDYVLKSFVLPKGLQAAA